MEEYTICETNRRVIGVKPELVTRFRWRADRRCRKLNAERRVDFYRYEVQRWGRARAGLPRRWAVVAMQNVAVPKRD